jgi:hypothetical protein
VSEEAGAYSLLYVEPLSDARTKLEDFFSILLGRDREDTLSRHEAQEGQG